MAKLIHSVPTAKLIEIKQLSPDENIEGIDWKWRMYYLNFEGALYLFESEHEHPGEHFVIMVKKSAPVACEISGKQETLYPADPCTWFHTSCGQSEMVEREIRIMTKSSYYIFQILDETLTEENKSKLKDYLELYEQVSQP